MRRMWQNFNAKKELRFHKQEHKKKKKKAETNGQGGNIEDMIEHAEFILYNADNLEWEMITLPKSI